MLAGTDQILFFSLLKILERIFNSFRRTHTIVNTKTPGSTGLKPLPDIGNLSPSLGLGAIGMPGLDCINLVHSLKGNEV